MLSFWAGGISSFPPCAREYRLLRRLQKPLIYMIKNPLTREIFLRKFSHVKRVFKIRIKFEMNCIE